MEEITGIRPSASSASIAPVSMAVISPTRPMSMTSPSISGLCLVAVMVRASSPVMPTASGPCWLSSPTSSRWTWPARTIRTTSMASGVVTRRPALNSLTRPCLSSWALICGPPPCTTTGLRPAWRRKTTSWAKAALSSSSIMALPPNLITTILPLWRRSQGRASMRISALGRAVCLRAVPPEVPGCPAFSSLMRSTRCSRGRIRRSGRWPRSRPTRSRWTGRR